MIFIYPALVSNTVDSKIVPIIAKTLEKFYLLQIQEAMTSGTIRVKTKWDGKKYGELILESKKVLHEIATTVDINTLSKSREENLKIREDRLKRYQDALKERDDFLKIIKSNENTLSRIKGNDSFDTDNSGNPKVGFKVLDSDNEELVPLDARSYSVKIDDQRKQLQNLQSRINDYGREVTDIEKVLSMNLTAMQNQKRFDEEKKEKESEKSKTHGSYKVTNSPGVDLQPTMGNVDVKIRYEGGNANNTSGSGQYGERTTIGVGVQILPFIINDFDSLQDVLLDDYFSNQFKVFFKSQSRSLLRKIYSFADKQWKRLTGGGILGSSGKDQAYKHVLLAPQGFVDASTFRQKSGAPKFYNYTSAIVLFNKTDITKTEEENFFLNSSKLKEMFEMGWNSFCVIDKEREEMTFVTMIDGGAVHRLPFSHLYHSAGASEIYKDLDPLRKKVSAFFIKSPLTIKTLGAKIAKENRIHQAVRKFLMG